MPLRFRTPPSSTARPHTHRPVLTPDLRLTAAPCPALLRPAPPPRRPDKRSAVRRSWSTQSEHPAARPTSVPLQQKAATVDNVAAGGLGRGAAPGSHGGRVGRGGPWCRVRWCHVGSGVALYRVRMSLMLDIGVMVS